MISRKLWRVWETNILFVLNTEFRQYIFQQHESCFVPNFIRWVNKVSWDADLTDMADSSDFQGQN